jgi:RNA polymerase sigma factor (sigma-70 family)
MAQELSDQQLLSQFIAHRDEIAFSDLLQRHARTVWGVCRRVLQQEQDAEDAFQAVFLVLARKASSIRQGTAVGSWLYAVAFRTAMKARHLALRRHTSETKADVIANREPAPDSEAACRELQRHLDEEVRRLAEKYRGPFVLCCLEGMSKAEAARELGCKQGTVSSRLARARQLLQKRLARRGFTLSAALTATALAQNLASAAAPPLLAQTTCGAVLAPVADFSLSPSVYSLADRVQRSMEVTRYRAGLLALAALLVLLTGASLATVYLKPSGRVEPAVVVEPETFLPPPVALGTPADEQVLAVAFSPDGRRLVTAGGRGRIPGQLKFWDVATAREVGGVSRIPGVRSVAFAPNGQTLATGDYGGAITLRDAQTGDEQALLPAHPGGVHGVAYSPDGSLLASAGLDGTAKLWSIDELKEIQVFRGHADRVLAVAFCRQGRALITTSQDKSARIWDLQTGKVLFSLEGHTAAVEAVAVSPDEQLVATASWDETVRLWNAETAQEVAVLRGNEDQAFFAVAFSPDGALLAGAGRDGTIRVWNAQTHESVGMLQKHDADIWALAFSRTGVLASGSSDRTARLWRFGAGNAPHVLMTSWSETRPILAAAYAPDGRVLGVATTDKTVHIRDAKSGDVLMVWHSHQDVVTCLAFSPDGQTLASGSADATVKLWDRATGELQRTLVGHVGGVSTVAFAPDGKQLASAGDDQAIRLWDAASGRVLATLQGHTAAIRALAYAPDGHTLASGGEDRSIKIWDVSGQTEIATLQGHEGSVRALAFSPGDVLASASDDATVKIWDLAQKTAQLTLSGHQGAVLALAFTPKGRALVSGGQDASVRVWDPLIGQARDVLAGHKAKVTTLAMHPYGENVVSGSQDTLLQRWKAGKVQVPGPRP